MARPSSRVLLCVFPLLTFVLTIFSQDPTSLAPNRTIVPCSEVILIVTGNTSNFSSMIVQVERTNSTSYIIEIPGCHIPYVCSRDPGSCNWARVWDNYVAVPGNGTVVFVKSQDDYFELSLPDCDPMKLVYDGISLWVACRREGSIQLLQFYDEESSSNRPTPAILFSSSNFILSSSDVDLYPIFTQAQECEPNFSQFIIVGNTIRGLIHRDFRQIGGELENCSRVESVSYLGGNNFTIYCDEGLTVTFDICSGQRLYHNQNKQERFYNCGGGLSVVYGTEHIQLTGSRVGSNQGPQNHSVGNIVHGQCNRNLFFVVSDLGDVYATSLTTGTLLLTFIDRVSLNSSCGWPYLDQNSLVVLSEERKYIFVVTAAKGCLNLARKEQRNSITDGILLPLPFSASTGRSDICQCLSGNQSLEMTTTATTEDTAEDSGRGRTSGQGDVTKSAAKTEPSGQGTTTDQVGNSSRQSNQLSEGQIAGISVGVTILVAIVIVIIVVLAISLGVQLSNK